MGIMSLQSPLAAAYSFLYKAGYSSIARMLAAVAWRRGGVGGVGGLLGGVEQPPKTASGGFILFLEALLLLLAATSREAIGR